MNMQRLMFEKQMASQVAWAREMFDWLGTFYALSSLGMFVGSVISIHHTRQNELICLFSY